MTETNITVGKTPSGIAYDPSNKEVYVVNTASNTTSAIKSTGGTPVTIKVGLGPDAVVYNPADKDIFVLNEYSGSVSVINGTNKVIHTLTLPGPDPTSLLVDPANGNVYVVDYNVTVETLFDLNHTTWKLHGVPLKGPSFSVLFDNATSDIVLAIPQLNDLQIVTPADSLSTIHLTKGTAPAFLSYDPANKDVLVADLGENFTTGKLTKTGNVTALGPANTIVKTLTVAAAPILAAYDPSDKDMFVVSFNALPFGAKNSTVTVLTSTVTVAKALAVGKYCEFPSYDAKNTEMYLPCTRSNVTYAINSTTFAVAAKVATPGNPVVAFYDPGISEMMVFNDPVFYNKASTTKTLDFVVPSSNTGVVKLTLGAGGTGDGLYDPTNSGVWVTNEGSGTVTVIT